MALGGFKITGRVVTQCSLSEYVTGELTVEHSCVPISSIDLQLLRVESVAASDRTATETSEIQSTQARLISWFIAEWKHYQTNKIDSRGSNFHLWLLKLGGRWWCLSRACSAYLHGPSSPFNMPHIGYRVSDFVCGFNDLRDRVGLITHLYWTTIVLKWWARHFKKNQVQGRL